MKIVKGMLMTIDMENEDEFQAYAVGQDSVKEATLLHSITFDPQKKKATIIYLLRPEDDGKSAHINSRNRSYRIVDVYVA